MRQRIDLGRLYRGALAQLEDVAYDGTAPLPWPAECPFSLDQLLRERRAGLEQHLRMNSPSSG